VATGPSVRADLDDPDPLWTVAANRPPVPPIRILPPRASVIHSALRMLIPHPPPHHPQEAQGRPTTPFSLSQWERTRRLPGCHPSIPPNNSQPAPPARSLQGAGSTMAHPTRRLLTAPCDGHQGHGRVDPNAMQDWKEWWTVKKLSPAASGLQPDSLQPASCGGQRGHQPQDGEITRRRHQGDKGRPPKAIIISHRSHHD
jgi:hypothetical protein